MTLAHWTHDLSPFLVRFPEGWPLDGIRFYGVAYLLGFAAGIGLLVLYRRKNRSPLRRGAEWDLLTYLLVGVIAGGRIGYVVLYDWPAFAANPLVLFEIWKGGMASHGGMAGVVAAAWLFARRHGLSFLRLGDLLATVAPVGLFFGRIANFVNGELWGRPSGLPWAVVFPGSPPDPVTGLPEPRHPSQLYQAFGEGVLLFAWLQWRFWRKPDLPAGRIGAEFLLGYGIVRFVTEFARAPDAPLILGLSRGQFYSIPLVLAGLYLLLRTGRRASGDRDQS
jgi:phosphatidylglycerol:prolipoprotein diacylglycerol transferase